MRKGSKFIALLLVLAMSLSVLAVSASASDVIKSGQCGDDAYWELTDDGVLTISGTGDMYDYSGTGHSPWYGCTFDTVIIEEGITSIGACAFEDFTNIKTVLLPDSLVSIEEGAFHYCTSLVNINFPSSLKTIGRRAFMAAYDLTGLTLPNGLIDIGESAFRYCESIESITIPASVITIGEYAFTGCYGSSEFIVDDDNEFYCSVDGVLFTKDMTELISYPSSKSDTTYIVPEGVIKVDSTSFQHCADLIELIFPKSFSEFEQETFAWCCPEIMVFMGDAPTITGSVFNGSMVATVYIPEGNATWDDIVSNSRWGGAKELTFVRYELPRTIEHIDAVAPTCTEPGNIEYWYVIEDDAYYSDADCTNEITYKGTIIPALGHKYTENPDCYLWVSNDDPYVYEATMTFVCERCGESVTIPADVDVCLDGDNYVYTVTAEYDDVLYESITAIPASDFENTDKTDKAELEALFNKIAELDEDKYTTESWDALQDALADAEAVYADENASQDDVNAAINALNKAIAELAEKTDEPADTNPDDSEPENSEPTDTNEPEDTNNDTDSGTVYKSVASPVEDNNDDTTNNIVASDNSTVSETADISTDTNTDNANTLTYDNGGKEDGTDTNGGDIQTLDIWERLIGFFGAALIGSGIAVGVTFHSIKKAKDEEEEKED